MAIIWDFEATVCGLAVQLTCDVQLTGLRCARSSCDLHWCLFRSQKLRGANVKCSIKLGAQNMQEVIPAEGTPGANQ